MELRMSRKSTIRMRRKESTARNRCIDKKRRRLRRRHCESRTGTPSTERSHGRRTGPPERSHTSIPPLAPTSLDSRKPTSFVEDASVFSGIPSWSSPLNDYSYALKHLRSILRYSRGSSIFSVSDHRPGTTTPPTRSRHSTSLSRRSSPLTQNGSRSSRRLPTLTCRTLPRAPLSSIMLISGMEYSGMVFRRDKNGCVRRNYQDSFWSSIHLCGSRLDAAALYRLGAAVIAIYVSSSCARLRAVENLFEIRQSSKFFDRAETMFVRDDVRRVSRGMLDSPDSKLEREIVDDQHYFARNRNTLFLPLLRQRRNFLPRADRLPPA